MSEVVRDVDSADFEDAVIAASHQRPVIADFWAPWCGPCLHLGPILERVVAEQDGAVLLVKINTDEAPHLAQRYGVRGIPAVKAFRDGRVVDEFTGAAPEPTVRAFVAGLAPGPRSDFLSQAEELRAAGDEKGARRLLSEVPRTDPQWQRADALLARMDLAAMAAEAGEADALAARRGESPEDRAVQLGIALHDLAAGRWSTGLAAALELVGDRNLGEPARQAMLAAFRAMDDPAAVRQWQSRLSSALY